MRWPSGTDEGVAALQAKAARLSVALEGRVCAVGGRRLSLTSNLPTLECYDPAAGTWQKLPDAPTARGGVGAAAVGDRLVFVGGERPEGTYREVELFSASSRQESGTAGRKQSIRSLIGFFLAAAGWLPQ